MSMSKVGRVLASSEVPVALWECGSIKGNKKSKSFVGFAGKNENSGNASSGTELARRSDWVAGGDKLIHVVNTRISGLSKLEQHLNSDNCLILGRSCCWFSNNIWTCTSRVSTWPTTSWLVSLPLVDVAQDELLLLSTRKFLNSGKSTTQSNRMYGWTVSGQIKSVI